MPSASSSPRRCPRRSSKASSTYLRKISPRTTCLYSLESIEPRSLSAAFHNTSSSPAARLRCPFCYVAAQPSSPTSIEHLLSAGALEVTHGNTYGLGASPRAVESPVILGLRPQEVAGSSPYPPSRRPTL